MAKQAASEDAFTEVTSKPVTSTNKFSYAARILGCL
jgi:hypothetical protein